MKRGSSADDLKVKALSQTPRDAGLSCSVLPFCLYFNSLKEKIIIYKDVHVCYCAVKRLELSNE